MAVGAREGEREHKHTENDLKTAPGRHENNNVELTPPAHPALPLLPH